MKKHTPGPWEVMDGFYPSIKEVFGASFKISCVMWATDLTEEDYQQRNADLHLIAAAPDLLEALKVARHMVVEDGTPIGWSVSRIDEVIAKATGKQP